MEFWADLKFWLSLGSNRVRIVRALFVSGGATAVTAVLVGVLSGLVWLARHEHPFIAMGCIIGLVAVLSFVYAYKELR